MLLGPTIAARGLAGPARARPRAERPGADAGLVRRLGSLAAVFDGSPEPVAVIDGAGRLCYANPPCAALFGCAGEDLVGRTVGDGAPFTGVEADPGQASRGSFELCRGQGESRWVSWSATPLCDDEGAGLGAVVFLRDDTERRRDEQRWSRRRDDLEQTIRAVAHDLRSPLVSVLGFSRLLHDDFGGLLGERGLHYLERIAEAGRTMESLIRELLDFARIGNAGEQRVPVDPLEVLEQLRGELKPRLDAAGVELRLPAEPPMLLCDRTRMYQLCSNLIGNALEHMGPCERPCVEVEVREDGDSHLLVVRDNGRGVDPAQHQRIFEMFHSIPRAGGRKGTGIGLAIVKKIAELHGGRAWVENAPGAGAAFHVRLPHPDAPR